MTRKRLLRESKSASEITRARPRPLALNAYGLGWTKRIGLNLAVMENRFESLTDLVQFMGIIVCNLAGVICLVNIFGVVQINNFP